MLQQVGYPNEKSILIDHSDDKFFKRVEDIVEGQTKKWTRLTYFTLGCNLAFIASTIALINCSTNECFDDYQDKNAQAYCPVFCPSSIRGFAIAGEIIGGIGSIIGCLKLNGG